MVTPKLKCNAPALAVDCPETAITRESIPRLVGQCEIDHTVKPSPLYTGGTRAARQRLRDFVRTILPRYHETRNEPSVDGTSRLSAYLHFGFISIQEIVAAVNQATASDEAKSACLEEAIVRRELSFNLTRFNAGYDSPAHNTQEFSRIPGLKVKDWESYDEHFHRWRDFGAMAC